LFSKTHKTIRYLVPELDDEDELELALAMEADDALELAFAAAAATAVLTAAVTDVGEVADAEGVGVFCTTTEVKVALEVGTVELITAVLIDCTSVSISLPSPQSAIGAALIPMARRRLAASGNIW
jgi:hypothetical protein